MIRKKKIAAIITASALALVTLTACSETTDGAQEQGQQQTEEAYAQQSQAVPYPKEQLKDSLERRNLKERLLRTNKPNQIGYIYLMSFGKIIGYHVIKGKVSSTQSQMTTDNLIVWKCNAGNCSHNVVNAPGDDGSYGANEPGIFYFLTNGTMVTTSLDYLYSDQPLPVDAPKLNS